MGKEITLSLLNSYTAYRSQMEKQPGIKDSDWQKHDLMDFFVQTMWEISDPDDPWDDCTWSIMDFDQWLKLDKIYRRRKKRDGR